MSRFECPGCKASARHHTYGGGGRYWCKQCATQRWDRERGAAHHKTIKPVPGNGAVAEVQK